MWGFLKKTVQYIKVHWLAFCFILFNTVKLNTCRNSLTDIFMLVSEMHHFTVKEEHAITLLNLFFKNYCLFESPWITKEPSLEPSLEVVHFFSLFSLNSMKLRQIM